MHNDHITHTIACYLRVSVTDRQTDRQTHAHTPTDRQTDAHTPTHRGVYPLSFMKQFSPLSNPFHSLPSFLSPFLHSLYRFPSPFLCPFTFPPLSRLPPFSFHSPFPEIQLGVLERAVSLPQRGLARSPSRKSNLVRAFYAFEMKNLASGVNNFSDVHEKLYIDFSLYSAKYFTHEDFSGAFAPNFRGCLLYTSPSPRD